MSRRASVVWGLSLCLVLLLTGCPPQPEFNAEKYLKKHRFSPAVIAVAPR